MSAGAMVTGEWPLQYRVSIFSTPDAQVTTAALVIALAGVTLGLIFTALIRKYFVETKELPYAMGQAAAETLQIGDEGGKKAGMLFSAMGLAGILQC